METQKFFSRNPETVHAPVAGDVHQMEVSGNVRWLVLSGQLGQHRDGTLSEVPYDNWQRRSKICVSISMRRE